MKTSPRTAFFLKAICCLVLTATLVFFNGCKKIDTPLEQPAPIDHSEPFFRLPTATNASVARVAAALQNLNTQQEFVNRFAKQYGFPVWDKVFALKQPNRAGSSFAGTVGTDTLIFIPLVLQGDTVVNGFIRARLNDSITLNYSLASDYKSYPEVRRDSLPSSKDFALLIMKLNQLTFGHNDFLLTDSSLFKQTKTTAFGTQPTKKMVRFKSSTGPSLLAGNGMNNVLIQSYCEDIVISICATNTSTPLQGNIQSIATPGGGGNCYTDFVEVCWDIITFTPGGGENPVPGGEPTGGGGGGGNGLPHYYPCPGTGNPFTAPICPPPGGGLGWVPLLLEPPYDPDLDPASYPESAEILLFEQDYRGQMSTQELSIFDGLNRIKQLQYLFNAKDALDRAQLLYPNSVLNGNGDAYRHAYFSALNAKVLGVSLAKQLGDAHETFPNSHQLENTMDLFNNQFGRDLFVTLSQNAQAGHFFKETVSILLRNDKIPNGDLRRLSPLGPNSEIILTTQMVPTN